MIKKIILTLCLMSVGLSCLADENDYLVVRGFQNLEKIQKLNVINMLSAIADNDGVEFSEKWSAEYFKDSGNKTYIYLTKNEPASLDVYKFDVVQMGENCYTKDNPEFCIPKIIPNIETYIYKERFLNETTPNFIEKPQETKTQEVLVQNSKFYDSIPIKSIKTNEDDSDEIYRKCDFEFENLKACQTLKKDTDDVISTEELEFKDKIVEDEPDYMGKLFKYFKYDSDGNKIEEYNFSKNKHIYYNEKGRVTGLEQFTKSNFKYSNVKNPEIYIDVEFKYDSYDRLVEELHFDENHKMIRHYTAEYEGDNISKIWVEDCLNGATWQIVPIKVRTGNEPSFAIRY